MEDELRMKEREEDKTEVGKRSECAPGRSQSRVEAAEVNMAVRRWSRRELRKTLEWELVEKIEGQQSGC